ncbi:winged helix-turn-helix domain-containing protein [Pseudomonas sp. BP01]|uniref:winged helix-turn-helix domain-containing protein n=1 Tax=Pseudomonas sp. BP01 TaxID=2976152 RepID=UPI001FA9B6A7|nr:winged helix-turn-helix domain-containing protein [Pseudomonas sp. BP01]
MNDLTFADLNLNVPQRQAICNDNRVVVKGTSFRLLMLLVSNADVIVSRQNIFQNVWGFTFDPGTKRIEVQLNYLRKVLRALGSSTRIETHRGKGLRLCETDN